MNSTKDFSSPENMIFLKTDLESGHFGSGTFEEVKYDLEVCTSPRV
jgi:hypothetical protein